MIVRYDKQLQRVWVMRFRIHHGLVGVLITALGAILMIDDFHDFPWLRDTP